MPSSRRAFLAAAGGAAAAATLPARPARAAITLQSFALNQPSRTGIHDVAPAPDGGVWFSAQRSGHLGWLDPRTGRVELVPLGPGSAPHGVVQGPDKHAWLTDGGQNAIVRVTWPGREVTVWKLPEDRRNANLNTAAFDREGRHWFTGQNGIYGRLDPASGQMRVWDAPKGRGPYGICATPAGQVWYCSLAGSYIAQLDLASGAARVVEPPTPNQGARRVWADSRGRIWVSEWNSGNLSMHDPASGAWKAWRPPGERPRSYAVYVDEQDKVWVTEWGGNVILRFDPVSEQFESVPMPRRGANVRQILGRPGEVFLPESGTEHLTIARFA